MDSQGKFPFFLNPRAFFFPGKKKGLLRSTAPKAVSMLGPLSIQRRQKPFSLDPRAFLFWEKKGAYQVGPRPQKQYYWEGGIKNRCGWR